MPVPQPVPDVPGEGIPPSSDPLPSPVETPGSPPAPAPDRIVDPTEDPNVNPFSSSSKVPFVMASRNDERVKSQLSDPAPLHDPDFPGDIPTIPSPPPPVDPTVPGQPTPAPEIPLPNPGPPNPNHPDPTAVN